MKRYVDKRVAHHDGAFEESVDVTWGEINEAIDVVEEVFTRYYGLLTVSALMIDDLLHSPWHHIFWERWIEPPDGVKRMRATIDAGG